MESQNRPLSPFSIAWAFSIVVHIANFPEWLGTVAGNAYLLAACFLLLKPSSVHRLMLALLFEAVTIIDHLPLIANHLYFVLIFDLTLLTIYLIHHTEHDLTCKLLQTAFPAVLMAQILLYLFAAFHKLNTDYFLPEVSSAVFFYKKIAEDVPLPALNSAGKLFVIYTSILIELLIPVLLLFKKTRPFGIVIGMSFHLFLSSQQFFGQRGLAAFSVTMFSIYIFYETERWKVIFTKSVNFLRGVFSNLVERLSRTKPLVPLALTVAFLISYDLFTNEQSGHSLLRRVGYFFWLALGTFYLISYLANLWQSRQSKENSTSIVLSSKKHLAPFIPAGIVIFLGLSPYLGLSTKGTFSMFSNLRVETETSNHLVIPTSWRLFPHNQDLIEVTASSHPTLQKYADRRQLINAFEIRRLVQNSGKDFEVVIRSKEESLCINHLKTPHHRLLRPLNPLAKKLIRFRPVDPPTRPSGCRH